VVLWGRLEKGEERKAESEGKSEERYGCGG
jgi:hypothetical protein